MATRAIGKHRRSGALAITLALVVGSAMPTGVTARTLRDPVIIVHGHSPDGRADS
jgi:hypothetical protein